MDLDVKLPAAVLPAQGYPAPKADPWLLLAGQEALPLPAPLRIDPSVLVKLPVDELYAAIADASRPEELTFDGAYSRRRTEFRHLFSYAIPSRGAVGEIAAFAGREPICEVGAGRGLWARLLAEEGVLVDASDYAIGPEGITNRKAGYFNESTHLFHPVRTQFARRAAAETSADTLMMVWPPYALPVASLSLTNFRGTRLVYIGEGRGDCTADDAFFDILAESWESAGDIEIPRWETMHDSVRLYRRR